MKWFLAHRHNSYQQGDRGADHQGDMKNIKPFGPYISFIRCEYGIRTVGPAKYFLLTLPVNGFIDDGARINKSKKQGVEWNYYASSVQGHTKAKFVSDQLL